MPAAPDEIRSLFEAVIATARNLDADDFDGWREQARMTLRLAFGGESEYVQRFDKIRFHPIVYGEGLGESARQRGVQQAGALLNAAMHEFVLAHEGTPASAPPPGVPARWAGTAVAALWRDGHYRQAVEQAARDVEVTVRTRLGIHGDPVSLMEQAFGSDPPKAGAPRLRFTGFTPGTEPWKNAHRGAMDFGKGCMARIRNLYVHGKQDPDQEEAAEALVAVTLLARWVDEAHVDPAPASTTT